MLPTRASYRPGEEIHIELDPAGRAGQLTVSHLGTPLSTIEIPAGAEVVTLPELPEGGYAVGLHRAGEPTEWTAVEVLAEPLSRLRYGFVAAFPPGRDVTPVTALFRRLHLTGAQFYDWAYRHASLVGPDTYTDPLGQPVSMDTVRAMSAGLRQVGTAPIGYAAVYAVGAQEWPTWRHAALLAPDGSPYALGDFLNLVDPADGAWLAHFTADLRAAARAGGFAGFHLDQYGYPRYAVRPDGRVVDVATAFGTLIEAVRAALPDETLIFNNVNDFPVWASTSSPQDVTYTEPWEPHGALADLAAVAVRSRHLAPTRPAVLAAYQTVYAKEDASTAAIANRLTMATLFSHGATQLLVGEDGRLLVDPYYVNNHEADPATIDLLARWYDLLVAAGDVLLAPGLHDITRAVVGGHNDEIDVSGPDVTVGHEAVAGTVWRRVVDTPHGQLVHLINLTGQSDTGWDTAKHPVPPVAGLTLRVRRVGPGLPTVRVADPELGPHFTTIPAIPAGNHAHVELPPLNVWQLVLISSTDPQTAPREPAR
ncbi:glycoside hydrolase family 66 protein [Micromonospora sp. NPDC048930]|uniref:glycoside hydrolase family 66 protein n=1 Tax=Micromonospora sp. NPDC048930 TaxID=3364261 RepID=UPI0037185174